MQRCTLLLGAAGLSFVLLLALLAIIGRNLRHSKRRNKLLAKQLDELQAQREKLYKTLAHVPSTPEKASDKGKSAGKAGHPLLCKAVNSLSCIPMATS